MGNNADLKGFKFSDDLIDVGEYVPNSFKVGGVSVTPQINGSKIEYTFPDGSISPKTVTFKTVIPDAKYYVGGNKEKYDNWTEVEITNTAKLLNDKNSVVKESSAKVTFAPKWITKKGEKMGKRGDTLYHLQRFRILYNKNRSKGGGVS